MYSLIRYPDGEVREAVVLEKFGSRIRLAVPGLDDVLELKDAGSYLLSETGQKLELEFLAGLETLEILARTELTSKVAS